MASVNSDKLLVILGPTASGKTQLAVQLAMQLNGEIISADSRQVYRSMTIGTGKDYSDYAVDGRIIPYHLIDIREAGEKYNLADFQKDTQQAITTIISRGRLPILCGGTGLYIEAILRGFEETQIPVNEALRKELEEKSMEELRQLAAAYEASSDIDTTTRKRLIRGIERGSFKSQFPENFVKTQAAPNALVIGLDPPLEARRERIRHRLLARLNEGLLAEVAALLARGLTPDQLIYYGLEYKYATLHLTGQLAYDEFVEKLTTEIHRFAKRQMTFFRSMERKGIRIHWLVGDAPPEQRAAQVVKLILEKNWLEKT